MVDEEEDLLQNDEGKEDLEDNSELKNNKVKDEVKGDVIEKNNVFYTFIIIINKD